MPGSQDAKRRICQMLDMSDEELMAELDRSFVSSDECDERIACSIEEMKQEIDRLLSKIKKLEEDDEVAEETDEVDSEPNQG